MPISDYICPHCSYEAPASFFENVGGGRMKCRRCRSQFADPDAYGPNVTYADCDSLSPVTRFPFALNTENTVVRVRKGYLALLEWPGGTPLWAEEGEYPVTGRSGSVQVYYVCLRPHILWGTDSPEIFGVHGSAQLSVSAEYVRTFYAANGHIMLLEDHLRGLVIGRVTKQVRFMIAHQSVGLLANRDSYQSLLGELEPGVSLTNIRPIRFRNGDTVTDLSYFIDHNRENDAAPSAAAFRLPPVPAEIMPLPMKKHTVAPDTEEVLIFSDSKAERHKTGDVLDADIRHRIGGHVLYRSKEFEFPFGWGVFDQRGPATGYYSAQGTISFYIDSTALLSVRLSTAGSWQRFEEQFFNDVLKKELSAALKTILDTYFRKPDFKPEKIGDHLSTMSIELGNILNGEGAVRTDTAIRKFGLRVRQTDILGIDLYAVRRE